MLCRWLIALLLTVVVSAACVHNSGSPHRRSVIGTVATLPDGTYRLCALMHTEVLQLQDGFFKHRMASDIGPERITIGHYTVQQDLVVFSVVMNVSGGPEGVDQLRSPFVIGKREDQLILWRGPGIMQRAEAMDSIGMYDFLVYEGPEIGPELSCQDGSAPVQ